MRRLLLTTLLTCVVLITHAGSAWGALGNYEFTQTTGSATDMSGATVLIDPSFGNDDTRSPVTDIGFTFNFNGTNYTQFSASSNGILGLGSGTIQANAYNNINATTGAYPIIAAFWDDMIPSGSGVIYTLTGTEGDQVLTVQWQGYLWEEFQDGSATHVDYTYQVRLYERENIFEFWYGEMSDEYVTHGNGQIGAASGSSDFVGVALNKSGPATASSVSTTVNDLKSTPIAENTVFRFRLCQKNIGIAGNTNQGGTTVMTNGDVLMSGSQVQRGNSGTFQPFTVSLSDTACAERTVTYTITGANAADYQISPGSQSVSINGSQTPTITFTPGGTGTRSATLRVTDDNGFSRTYTLSGRGTTRIEWTGNIAQGGTSTVANGDTLMKNIEVRRLQAQNFTPVTIRNFNTNGAYPAAPVTATLVDPSGQFTLLPPTSASLMAGASYSPIIRFAPTGVGFQNATLTITAEGETRTFPLKALSIAPGGSFFVNNGEITSETPLFTNQFGCVGEFANTQQVTIVNTGRGDYVISSFDVYQTDTAYQQGTPRYPISRDRFGNPIRINDYFLTTQPGVAPPSANQMIQFPFIIPQGESRTVYITFIGRENGKRFGRVFIGTNSEMLVGSDINGDSTEGLLVVDLFGSGVGGRLADNANGGAIKTMIFAPTRVGDSIDMTYRFFNTGKCDLRISFEKLAITSGDVHDFRLLSAFGRTIIEGMPMTGDAILAPDASGTMVIRFKPQRNGSRRATLWMQTSDSSQVIDEVTERGAYYLDLYGFGRAFLDYSDLKLKPAVINGVATTGSTRLVNSSLASVGIEKIEFFGGDAAQFSEYAAGGAWPATPFTLIPGAEIVLGVQMLATGIPGARATTLRITTVTDEVIDIAITSEAGSQSFAVNPDRLFVGARVATATEKREVVMITNTGTLPLRLDNPMISGPGAAAYRLSSFPRLVLEPNATEYLEVTFSPVVEGVADAQLTISSDAGTEVVILEGEGIRARRDDPDPTATLPGRGGLELPELSMNAAGTSSMRDAAAARAGVAFDAVRPNPARERAELVFQLAQSADVRIDLYDAAGRLVSELASGARTAGEHRLMVDVSQLGAGVYHCRLTTGGVELSRSLIVAH